MTYLEEHLQLSSLTESIRELGYRAKEEESPDLKWISSSAGGYRIFVVPFNDALKLRAVFDYMPVFTWEVINKFNAENRLAKIFRLGEEPSEFRLAIDLDCLAPDSNFDDFLRRVFSSFEFTLAAFDRLLRDLLDTASEASYPKKRS